MDACENCTTRLFADLFEALGSAEKADEIRARGCGWWWGVQEENKDTGQTRVKWECGRAMLPHFLRSFGLDVTRAVDVVQADRKETADAVSAVTAQLAMQPALVQQLAGVGLRAVLAARLREAGHVLSPAGPALADSAEFGPSLNLDSFAGFEVAEGEIVAEDSSAVDGQLDPPITEHSEIQSVSDDADGDEGGRLVENRQLASRSGR